MNILKETNKSFSVGRMPGVVMDVGEAYRRNVEKLKKEEEVKKSRLIDFGYWPNFPDYELPKLLKVVYRLMDELDNRDIPFIGINVGVDFNQPLLIIHMDRGTRGLEFAEEMPEEIMKLKVITVIDGKFRFV